MRKCKKICEKTSLEFKEEFEYNSWEKLGKMCNKFSQKLIITFYSNFWENSNKIN